jgi:hypothetical protein
LLVTGKTDTEAAAALGVHRTTVSAWRQHHPAFRAELNRRRKELYGAAADRLRGMVGKALDALESALAGENPLPAALHVLKAASLDRLDAPSGPVDAADIIDRMVSAELHSILQNRLDLLAEPDRLLAELSPRPLDQMRQDLADARRIVAQELRFKACTEDPSMSGDLTQLEKTG